MLNVLFYFSNSRLLTNTREPHQLESYDIAHNVCLLLFSTLHYYSILEPGWFTLVHVTKTSVNWDSLNKFSQFYGLNWDKDNDGGSVITSSVQCTFQRSVVKTSINPLIVISGQCLNRTYVCKSKNHCNRTFNFSLTKVHESAQPL